MSLEPFRRTRMVILSRQAKIYQAARAMADNHIGAVLVTGPNGLEGIVTDRDLALAGIGGGHDPRRTPLGEIMSEDVVTCDIKAGVEEVVRLMREHGVRRIPITENGRVVGLVTFDDLVVEGSIPLAALRSIVAAQLEVEAPHKPAGMLHPEGTGGAAGRARALMRAKSRAEASYNMLVKAVEGPAGLDRDRAERALLVGICMLCRRLSPQEAHQLVAQLPSMLQPKLAQCLDGPDRNVTAKAIEAELASVLGLDAARAAAALRAVCDAITGLIAAGEVDEIRGQLPEDMKPLFPQTLK